MGDWILNPLKGIIRFPGYPMIGNYSSYSCQDILNSTMINTTRIIIHQLGSSYHRSVTIALSPALTDSDGTFIDNFRKTFPTDLRKSGQLRRLCLVNPLCFYNEVKWIQTKNKNQATDSLYLQGTYSFIKKSIAMYKYKFNNDFNNSLVMCLIKSFFANMSGKVNPLYYSFFFNLYLDISYTSRKNI